MKEYLRKDLYSTVRDHKKRESHKFKKDGKAVSKWTKLQLYNHVIKHNLGLPGKKKKIVKAPVKKIVKVEPKPKPVKKVVKSKPKLEFGYFDRKMWGEFVKVRTDINKKVTKYDNLYRVPFGKRTRKKYDYSITGDLHKFISMYNNTDKQSIKDMPIKTRIKLIKEKYKDVVKNSKTAYPVRPEKKYSPHSMTNQWYRSKISQSLNQLDTGLGNRNPKEKNYYEDNKEILGVLRKMYRIDDNRKMKVDTFGYIKSEYKKRKIPPLAQYVKTRNNNDKTRGYYLEPFKKSYFKSLKL